VTEAADKLILVSSNPNKGIEAERILGVPVLRVSISLLEIQAATVEEVTRYKLEQARSKGYGRLLEAAGGKGVGAIAYALLDRSAKAECCVAYWDGETPHLFKGETPGQILVEPRGEPRFGWDAWFQPAGSTRTFAEMSPEEKDQVSHRGKAYRQLASLLKDESVPSTGRR
jgi:XTP/dITP diphosphohydrolase